jgi:hypothetical protein
MKISHYDIRLIFGILLTSAELQIAVPLQAITQVTGSRNTLHYIFSQERRYVTDGLFEKANGQWQFKVNQKGKDLQFEGHDNVKGRVITLTGVQRGGSKERLIYTWRNSNSSYRKYAEDPGLSSRG